MAKIEDVTFQAPGASYSFEAYPLGELFNAVGTVYIFTKRTANMGGGARYTPLYIGQTDSLADRIPNHEKVPCVSHLGCDTICVQGDGGEQSRLRKETALRAAYQVPCNDQ